jgi:hypothetical protein
MQFKTRQMDLAKALDEVFLRLFLLGFRVLQALVSIPVIGFRRSNHQRLSRMQISAYPVRPLRVKQSHASA